MSNFSNLKPFFQFPFNLSRLDIQRVYDIDSVNMKHSWSLKSWHNCLTETDLNWFILHLKESVSCKIFAFIVGRICFKTCTIEVDKVAVDKPIQGQGYANLLFFNLYKELTNLRKLFENNEISIVLDVEESNKIAISCYKKQGLEPIGRRKEFYSCGSSAITYRKYLKLFE